MRTEQTAAVSQGEQTAAQGVRPVGRTPGVLRPDGPAGADEGPAPGSGARDAGQGPARPRRSRAGRARRGGAGPRGRAGGAAGAAGGAAAPRAQPGRVRGPAATGKSAAARARPSRSRATRTRRPASPSRAPTAAPRRRASRPTQINVSYRITSDSESFQQTLAPLGGANITDTTADIERTVDALATYFDKHFQFYGRKLNIEFFNGQGSITNELLGSGQQQADADAVTAAQSAPCLRRAQRRDRALRRGAGRPARRSHSGRRTSRRRSWASTPPTCGASTPSATTWSRRRRSSPQVARRRQRRSGRAACRASRGRSPSSPRATLGTRTAPIGGPGGGGGRATRRRRRPVPAGPVDAVEPGRDRHQPAAERRHHDGGLRLRPGLPRVPHLAGRKSRATRPSGSWPAWP